MENLWETYGNHIVRSGLAGWPGLAAWPAWLAAWPGWLAGLPGLPGLPTWSVLLPGGLAGCLAWLTNENQYKNKQSQL